MYDSEELRDRLFDLGFETEESEEELLKDSLKRAEQSIMNSCNTECVPSELRFVALDIAAGEYLLAAKAKREESRGIKSISEGDVSVSFEEEGAIDGVIDSLLSRGREEILSYRRIKW